MNERQRNVALFRYSLIREAADPSLTTRQRGQLVRQLAATEHSGPDGHGIRMSRGTIDRWIRDYRNGGFEALAPDPRKGEPVTEQRLLDLAESLKREVPRRTAAQVAQIIRTAEGGVGLPSAPSSATSPVSGSTPDPMGRLRPPSAASRPQPPVSSGPGTRSTVR